MGILNTTPDSFSDGGRFEAPALAAARGREMVVQGAAVLDIGGESTRPGFTPVPADMEWARIAPVLGELVAVLDVPISVDTTKSAVARRALAAGAGLINDIWGFQGDPAMAETVAEACAAAVLMHNRDRPDPAVDIVDDMRRFFDRSLDIARRAGVPTTKLILDPGIGFGKTPSQQLDALRGIAKLLPYGLPLLVGVSRKSFLGRITGAAVGQRAIETIAANLAAAAAGARLFRVHDVSEHVTALKVFEAIHGGAA